MSSHAPSLGLVTIGQAPRPDLMTDIRAMIGDGPIVFEAGALDAVGAAELPGLAAVPGEVSLISRLRNGSTVEISRERAIPLLQDALTRVADAGARIFAILCTSEFPTFQAPGPILLPNILLANAIHDIGGVRRVGLMPPLESQVTEVAARWRKLGYEPTVEAATPYGPDAAILGAAERLRRHQVDVVIPDCQGYRSHHLTILRSVLDCQILLPNTVVGERLREYFA